MAEHKFEKARLRTKFLAAIAALLLSPAIARADCGSSEAGFGAWLERFKGSAAKQGISQKTLSGALSGISYSRQVIRLDRSQRSFKQSFDTFYKRRASPALISRGRQLMKRHAALLSRIEKQYGVPGQVLVTIWGLETYYGSNGGKLPIIASLATLAYDCRRSAFFRNELMAALRILQRGDMSAAQMRGGWAGEIGQTQFLASSYYKYAVDYDGNGRRDLIRSVPDLLASTANYLRAYGWKRGQPWSPGSANFGVIKQWNKADVYARTIARAAVEMGR